MSDPVTRSEKKLSAKVIVSNLYTHPKAQCQQLHTRNPNTF